MEIEAKVSYTYADYAKLPEGAPYQLIQGELIMSPSPTIFHQIIISNLSFLLQKHVRSRKIGFVLVAPVDVYLSDINTFQPDVVYVSADRLSIVEEKNIQGAPDLVIEVLSPSTAYYDLRRKKDVYAEYGVHEYWIVDPIEKSVEIYVLEGKKLEVVEKITRSGLIESRVVEEFSIKWADVFDKGLLGGVDI